MQQNYQALVDTPSLSSVFSAIEMPVMPVLMSMEQKGALLDIPHLRDLEQRLEKENQKLVQDIYQHAGTAFNLNSTQQLSKVLFTNLGLTPGKKTKTGYSTDAATLEKLKHDHPIVALLLDYRHREKLLNTYIKPLPDLVLASTGRLHTSFNQTVTTTGRLSSSNPNLQNIPVRTALGREIRRAFVAPPGYKLLSCDYSQIELRLLAHWSGDVQMIEDFAQGMDIHAATARRIFKVTGEAEVTKQQRSIAKAINFATVYGAGAKKLAESAGITQNEAKEFTSAYFAHYPSIATFIESLRQRAREKGYAETLFGRQLPLPDINSSGGQYRAAAERIAVNMPLQGTAADIMKLAMIKVAQAINEHETYAEKVFILLQVHDELVLEVEDSLLGDVVETVKTAMENVIELKVALVVDAEYGQNWAALQ